MKNVKKKLNNQSEIVKVSFTGSNITRYGGLNTVAKYMNAIFIKTLGKCLTGSPKWHKNKESLPACRQAGRKIREPTRECMGEVSSSSLKSK